MLDKDCRISMDDLTSRLIEAKRHVPFVQGNLIGMSPVPLFPYPGSPDYRRLWGEADDQAWERAHHFYLERHRQFSDVQDEHPLPLSELERLPPPPRSPASFSR